MKKFIGIIIFIFFLTIFTSFAYGENLANYNTTSIETAIITKIEKSITDKIKRNQEFNDPSLLILDYDSDVKILNMEEQNKDLIVKVEEIRTYFYNNDGPETISKNIHTFKLSQQNGLWIADYVKDGAKIE